ncbi:MAG: hypothetical protein NC087_04570 [Anaeroplasma bactoclasticum]|nr:hypothetical protein [Anaeroplasma bactoclasticum]
MNKVKGYRVMVNMTQEEMARKLGISRETFNFKEKNDRFTTAEAIAITSIFNEQGLNLKRDEIFLGQKLTNS